MPTLKIGQSIEVVYINPETGALSVNLVTEADDVALHFNPRYSEAGGYLVLNTLFHGVWQNEVYPPGFPFPANNVRTTVAVRITAEASGFVISVNGFNITTFHYRDGLNYDTVRYITWVIPGVAVVESTLESIKVTY